MHAAPACRTCWPGRLPVLSLISGAEHHTWECVALSETHRLVLVKDPASPSGRCCSVLSVTIQQKYFLKYSVEMVSRLVTDGVLSPLSLILTVFLIRSTGRPLCGQVVPIPC